MNILYITLSALIIVSASIAGVALIRMSKKAKDFINNRLAQLSALSAGIFLVTSFIIGRESYEILGHNSIYAFLSGIILYTLIHQISHGHRHKGDSEDHTHEHDKSSAIKIIVGDAIHNIADGILLVASFGTSLVVGISNALSIFIHEVPQEISEFIVLKKSGYTTTEAAYRNIATACSIFIGVGIGLALSTSPKLQAVLLGVSASFFLGIIFKDLIPKKIFSRKNLRSLAAFILGIIIMFGIMQSQGHSHENGEHGHSHNHPHTENKNHEDHLH